MTQDVSTSEQTQAKSETRMQTIWNWITDKLLASTIMLIVGLLVGSWWNNASPHLSYTMGEPIFFSGEKESFALFVLTIASDGRKAAENIQCEVDLGDSTIEDIKGEPQFLKPKINKSEAKASIEVPSMNPTERLELAIKASTPKEPAKPRTIRLRAKDTVGVVKTTDKWNYRDGLFLGFCVIVGCSNMFALISMTFKQNTKAFHLLMELNRSRIDKQLAAYQAALKTPIPNAIDPTGK